MSPPSTVQSELFSDSMTSVDTSQSEETLHQVAKSGTSQTTSVTVNMAAGTWSRRSGSSTIPPKGVKLAQQKTPVVRHCPIVAVNDALGPVVLSFYLKMPSNKCSQLVSSPTSLKDQTVLPPDNTQI